MNVKKKSFGTPLTNVNKKRNNTPKWVKKVFCLESGSKQIDWRFPRTLKKGFIKTIYTYLILRLENKIMLINHYTCILQVKLIIGEINIQLSQHIIAPIELKT